MCEGEVSVDVKIKILRCWGGVGAQALAPDRERPLTEQFSTGLPAKL